jgi:hypothetical protein
VGHAVIGFWDEQKLAGRMLLLDAGNLAVEAIIGVKKRLLAKRSIS